MADVNDRIIQAFHVEILEVVNNRIEHLEQIQRQLKDGTYPLMAGNCHAQEHMPKLPGTEQQGQIQGRRGTARARKCPSGDSTFQSHARKAGANDRSRLQCQLSDTTDGSDAPGTAEHLDTATYKPYSAVVKRKARNLRYKPGARRDQVDDARKPRVRRVFSDVYYQPAAGVTRSDGNYQPDATKTDVKALKGQGGVKSDWYERHSYMYIETLETDL
jgi:hypothetical protein